VPALTAFLNEQLQASQTWWMPDISGTPDILTESISYQLSPSEIKQNEEIQIGRDS
jgi:hypothetical protein